MLLAELAAEDLKFVVGGIYEDMASADDGGGEVVYVDGQPFLKTLRVSMSNGSYYWNWWYTPYTP